MVVSKYNCPVNPVGLLAVVPMIMPDATSRDLVIYAQLTFPVPAVIVVTLNPPLGALSVPVTPAPKVIV
jgi:hypothetical protein